jgi:hypothetical protein
MISKASRESQPASWIDTRSRRSLLSSEQVGGAAYPERPAVQHMGIDHDGTHILMTHQFLDRADVLAALQQVCGKGIAKAVAAGSLVHPCGSLHLLQAPLYHGWIDVMPALGTCRRIRQRICGRSPTARLTPNPLDAPRAPPSDGAIRYLAWGGSGCWARHRLVGNGRPFSRRAREPIPALARWSRRRIQPLLIPPSRNISVQSWNVAKTAA